MAERPSTPPGAGTSTRQQNSPLTPERVRRMEENRLKAKALRAQHEAAARAAGNDGRATRTPAGFIAGQKRPYASRAIATTTRTQRDARQSSTSTTPAPGSASASSSAKRPHDEIQAARKFTKYVEYDFSKMTDTKGGFLTAEDDPHNRALHSAESAQDEKPAHMTFKEWERHQLLKRLREQKAGPFEPGLSVLEDASARACTECGALEIDWQWAEVFGVRVCSACKERLPEKYSLLTKSEAKADYLLTDPELRDPELLPRLEKPNPHKATWHNMQLYLRCQVEEYAFSDKKWGSAEALDAEFEKREGEKKKRKEDKFKAKLLELKKRTRVEAYKRGRGSGGGEFGDHISSRGDKHEHEWGRTLTNAEGVGVKKCVECGMEVEELEF